MQLLTKPTISPEGDCPYLDNHLERHEFFFAMDINKEDMDILLCRGWRKFGQFLFRPNCQSCSKCLPLRVVTQSFSPSKSDRRNIRKNDDVKVNFIPLNYKKIYFELYLKHSTERFNDKFLEKEEDFIQSFFTYSGTQIISEFILDDKLIAFGILDQGEDSLSSAYFVFDTDFKKRGLGKFGALKEIEYADKNNLIHYYLGYWIEDNKSMRYKKHFRPFQTYDWKVKLWSLSEEV